MTTINFSEIRQEKKNYLIQHGIDVFNTPWDDSLITRHDDLCSIIIELKLMANGSIHYVLKPTSQFSKAFQRWTRENDILTIINDIELVINCIKGIHKKYDELEYDGKELKFMEHKHEDRYIRDIRIKKVIFNKPYTIVLWKDGSKTKIKCDENDVYDKEKGLALCIAKKAYGNRYGWYDIFQKYIPELKEEKKDAKE